MGINHHSFFCLLVLPTPAVGLHTGLVQQGAAGPVQRVKAFDFSVVAQHEAVSVGHRLVLSAWLGTNFPNRRLQVGNGLRVDAVIDVQRVLNGTAVSAGLRQCLIASHMSPFIFLVDPVVAPAFGRSPAAGTVVVFSLGRIKATGKVEKQTWTV
jgi:hypothetical protein